MSAEVAEQGKIGESMAGSPPKDDAGAKKGHRRTSSSVTGVFNINDLEAEGKEIEIAQETQKLNWKLNTSPSTVDDREALKKFLTTPPVKKIDLHFPLGLEVTARNMKGVTIKDALDAIYKQYKKKADDELEEPILAGFEWDKEESWTRLIVHQKKEGAPAGKKKGKKGEE
ncbi:MAG: hypothetical protein M1823_001649 [Watsoniomyces obsoletus]|nr:MAG: hypothetical protein M1823_001649 [Watsoniomyces obsoletus]